MSIRVLGSREDCEPTEHYMFTNGWVMCREVPFPYYWILRDENGEQKERDKYRNDIIERFRLTVETHTGQ